MLANCRLVRPSPSARMQRPLLPEAIAALFSLARSIKILPRHGTAEKPCDTPANGNSAGRVIRTLEMPSHLSEVSTVTCAVGGTFRHPAGSESPSVDVCSNPGFATGNIAPVTSAVSSVVEQATRPKSAAAKQVTHVHSKRFFPPLTKRFSALKFPLEISRKITY